MCNRSQASRVLIGTSVKSMQWTKWPTELCSLESAARNRCVRSASWLVNDLSFMCAMWQCVDFEMMNELESSLLLADPGIGLVLLASRSLLILYFVVRRMLLLIVTRLLAETSIKLLRMSLCRSTRILRLLWTIAGCVLPSNDSPVKAWVSWHLRTALTRAPKMTMNLNSVLRYGVMTTTVTYNALTSVPNGASAPSWTTSSRSWSLALWMLPIPFDVMWVWILLSARFGQVRAALTC